MLPGGGGRGPQWDRTSAPGWGLLARSVARPIRAPDHTVVRRDVRLGSCGNGFPRARPGRTRCPGDAASIKANLIGYLHGFSENLRDIFERPRVLRLASSFGPLLMITRPCGRC
jgi:hypothetical protein